MKCVVDDSFFSQEVCKNRIEPSVAAIPGGKKTLWCMLITPHSKGSDKGGQIFVGLEKEDAMKVILSISNSFICPLQNSSCLMEW